MSHKELLTIGERVEQNALWEVWTIAVLQEWPLGLCVFDLVLIQTLTTSNGIMVRRIENACGCVYMFIVRKQVTGWYLGLRIYQVLRRGWIKELKVS